MRDKKLIQDLIPNDGNEIDESKTIVAFDCKDTVNIKTTDGEKGLSSVKTKTNQKVLL